MTGILVLLLLCAICSLIVHASVPNYMIACLISAGLASVLFQFVNYIHMGFLDPFFVIALFTGGAFAFGVSMVAGFPFLIFRRR